ncbi:hypothetical protein LTR36_005371 [Oleoguttula mirabilis]|uniref:Elongation factor 1-beta n=1 Tax=Oleoguttula mirabilis TaxID=1507867 RepID=A0AAV9JG23_9PEZI|nr:hypothetical protein LTR36_005371 [Oleoguttula mirabilis]
MGFTDFLSDTGLTLLDNWVRTRSYIIGYTPSQADVKSYQALKSSPAAEKYPHAYRWYKHIASLESEFSSLPGDPSKEYTAYGPESSELATNPAKAPNSEKEVEGGEKEVESGEKEVEGGDEEEEVDLFGSDDDEEEDPEAERLKAERLEEYRKKKAGKTKPAAKSMVTLDVKPWDDETDMKALEAAVRGIEKDGLVWGGAKLVAVGFGIKKLQINLVVEDDKISVDELQEQIEGFEDYVQSSDIAAMMKL